MMTKAFQTHFVMMEMQMLVAGREIPLLVKVAPSEHYNVSVICYDLSYRPDSEFYGSVDSQQTNRAQVNYDHLRIQPIEYCSIYFYLRRCGN